MTSLSQQMDYLLSDTHDTPPPPHVPSRLRLRAIRNTVHALRLLQTHGWGPAHQYHRNLRPGPGWQQNAALQPHTALLLVRREIFHSQLALRAVTPNGLCLPRALSLGVYLSTLGLPAEVVLARTRAPFHPKHGFHAWTELYGEVLNDHPEVQLGHTILQRVSAQSLGEPFPT